MAAAADHRHVYRRRGETRGRGDEMDTQTEASVRPRRVTSVETAFASAATGVLRRSWWALGARGIAAVLLGAFALGGPDLPLATWLAIAPVYLVSDGLLILLGSLSASRDVKPWWPYFGAALASVTAGVLALSPGAMPFAVLLLVAARSIVVGAVELAAALGYRRDTGVHVWDLGLAGLACIVFGMVLVAHPAAGVAWTTGAYAVVFGGLCASAAVRIRSFAARFAARQLTAVAERSSQ